MKLQRNIWLVTLLLVALASGQLAHAQETPLGGFDDYVNTQAVLTGRQEPES